MWASLRDLDEFYPDALFILNTRPLEKWILSSHKAVARFRTVARWALTRYVPLGWSARLIDRTLLDNRPRAMARWVSVRNSYHRHVLEYFQGRDEKLPVDSMHFLMGSRRSSSQSLLVPSIRSFLAVGTNIPWQKPMRWLPFFGPMDTE